MPGFWSSSVKSTAPHRKVMRVNAVTGGFALLSQDALDPTTVLISKIPQAAAAIYTGVWGDIKPFERGMQIEIGTVALLQVACALAMYAMDTFGVPHPTSLIFTANLARILSLISVSGGALFGEWVRDPGDDIEAPVPDNAPPAAGNANPAGGEPAADADADADPAPQPN